MKELAVILMGSKSDAEHSGKISKKLKEFGIDSETKIASAHKNTELLLKTIKQFDSSGKKIIYVAVAGRSNALCGVLEGNTLNPVITCPPYSEKYKGLDILSSLRMPSGMGCTTILEPENAALAVAKIFALENEVIRRKVQDYKEKLRRA